MISLALIPSLTFLSLFQQIKAQAHSVEGYPEWVTNDYNCVIDCLKIFNETVTEKPNSALETQAYGCVTNTCSQNEMGMNIYQSKYIIEMFYATGSIYENPNMGDWGQGTPPSNNGTDNQQSSSSTSSEAAPTSTATPISGSSGAIHTSSGVSSTSQSPTSSIVPSVSGVASNLTASQVPSSGAFHALSMDLLRGLYGWLGLGCILVVSITWTVGID